MIMFGLITTVTMLMWANRTFGGGEGESLGSLGVDVERVAVRGKPLFLHLEGKTSS